MNIFGNNISLNIQSFDDKDISYGIFKNGLFKKIKTQLGTFTVKIQDNPVEFNLTKECSFNFEQGSIRKIPISFLKTTIEFYKYIYQHIKSEVFSCIVYDKVSDKFFINVPPQTVSGAQVDYEREDWLYQNPDYLIVLELHSHAGFSAFFSSGDVKDEVAGRFFGVIGDMPKDTQSMVFKVAYDRQYKDLEYTDLFDEYSIEECDLDFEEAYSRVKEKIYEVRSSTPIDTSLLKTNTSMYDYENPYDISYESQYTTSYPKSYQTSKLIYDYDFKMLFLNNRSPSDLNMAICNIYHSLSNLILDTYDYESDQLYEIAFEAISSI